MAKLLVQWIKRLIAAFVRWQERRRVVNLGRLSGKRPDKNYQSSHTWE